MRPDMTKIRGLAFLMSFHGEEH